VRRFLAVFHPEAKFEDTEIITEAGGHRFRTRGRRLVEAGWRAAAFGEEAAAEEPAAGDDDELRQSLPKVDEGESGTCEKAEVLEKQTKPPPRYSEASLLKDMETAGKQIEDEELRDAMKEAGLGTPATRAETIEKLIRVGYIERLGKQLRATSKGRQAIALLGDHALTSAQLTGSWEKRLSDIERGAGARDAFMHDIRDFTSQIVEYFRELSSDDVRALRAEIGPCPNCDGIIRENRLAYGCSSWKSREEPGCGFVIWKQQKGRSISPAEARDLLEHGQTELLDGFKTRPSRARLVLVDGAVQLLAEDGTRLDAPAGPREVIAPCPKCAAEGRENEIRENSRAYGCSSWKSRKDAGCGFVIWKSTKGRTITAEEARQVIETGASDWMEFKDRKGPFRGRLKMTDEHTVEIEREDEGSQAATRAA
jgi:DNA topoisomerase-3